MSYLRKLTIKVAYIRVSTPNQNLDGQEDEVIAAGAEQVFADVASRAKRNRPQLDQVKAMLRPGDTVIIQRLDRLGRSMKDLVDWVQWFEENEVKFISLKELQDNRYMSYIQMLSPIIKVLLNFQNEEFNINCKWIYLQYR